VAWGRGDGGDARGLQGVARPLAYAITAVRKLAGATSARRASFSSAGLRARTEFLAFAVGSARVTGGGTIMTPDASVTDGLLDLCVIENMSRRDFARLAMSVKRGEHLGCRVCTTRSCPGSRCRAPSR
jgi:diacylglycerol kinase family enzyme